jgi:hypothetical protein
VGFWFIGLFGRFVSKRREGGNEGQVRLFAVGLAPGLAVRGLHVPREPAELTGDRDGLAVRGVHGLLHTIHVLHKHVFANGVGAALHVFFNVGDAFFVQFDVFGAGDVLVNNGMALHVFVDHGVAFFVHFDVFFANRVFFEVRMANFVGFKISFALEDRMGRGADAFGEVRGAESALGSALLPYGEVGVANYMAIPMDRALLMNGEVVFAGGMNIKVGFANLMGVKIGFAFLMDGEVRFAGGMDIIVRFAGGVGVEIGFAILVGFALLDFVDVRFADIDPVHNAKALFFPRSPLGAVFDHVAVAMTEAISMALGLHGAFPNEGRDDGGGERRGGDKQGAGNDAKTDLHTLFPLLKI